MHPIIYTELKQTLRDYKGVLFLFTVMAAIRIAFGDFGHLINLFFVFPIVAGSISIGMLIQEYSKDNFKYLYSLPINRLEIIFIKFVSSVVGIGLFLLVIYVFKWIIPPRLTIPEMFLFKVFNLSSLLLLSVFFSAFCYGVCMFSITFMRSCKAAGTFSYFLIIAAILYLGYCFLDTGYKYKMIDYGVIFLPTFLMLFSGGFYLFTLRNPFLNKNPRHFITGIVIFALSVSYFTLTTQVVCRNQMRLVFRDNSTESVLPENKSVQNFYVSPDGEYVFVTVSNDHIIPHSFILDSSGKLVADLGRNSTSFRYGKVWHFEGGKKRVLYNVEKPLLSSLSRKNFSKHFVLDIESQTRYSFDHIFSDGDIRSGHYLGFDNSSMELMAVGYEKKFDRRGGLFVYKQNVVTGGIRRLEVPDSMDNYANDCKMIDGRRILIKVEDHYDIEGKKNKGAGERRFVYKIFDTKNCEIVKKQLPLEVANENDYHVSNGKCYFLETLADETGYSYRLACRSDDGYEVVVSPDGLPNKSYREIVEDELYYNNHITLSCSRQKKWIQCNYVDRHGENQLLLIDQAGNRIIAPLGRISDFSPSERRFLTILLKKEAEDVGRKVCQIYEIVENKLVFAKEFETVKNEYGYKFLNDNEMIYIENPSSDGDWVNNCFLLRLNLKTMESVPLF